MTINPEFKLYGEDDLEFIERVQPQFPIREWSKISVIDKEKIWQHLFNEDWFSNKRKNVIDSAKQLNKKFMRLAPARKTFGRSSTYPDINEEFEAAMSDFREILINEESDGLALLLLSLFASSLIDQISIERATFAEDNELRMINIDRAYSEFDRFANHLNCLFEQFSVNIVVLRSGMVTRQDDRITRDIYKPTLEILSDPKWEPVDSIIKDMFLDNLEQKYSEVVTKAHSALHRFLQLAMGREGYSGKGEFSKLLKSAKSTNLISNYSENEDILRLIQSILSSQRAKKSTAKPTSQKANSKDALLAMNVCIVLIQHCLQNIDQGEVS